VSLDCAKSWQLADIRRAGPPNAYGKHWAWVHWELRIPLCESLISDDPNMTWSRLWTCVPG
jgi:nitrate reductase (NAD(P)H)